VVPAVILAAGLGKRIGARTNGAPKALLPLHGRTLLDRSLAALDAVGFRDVVVVTGHAPEPIREAIAGAPRGLTVRERWNPDYATANNIVSMLAAGDALAGGFCLLNSDIVFDPTMLVDVAGLERGNWLVVDGDEPLGPEEMKVEVDVRGRLSRISKGLDPTSSVGEYIGICRFDADGAATVMGSAARLVADGATDRYYEDAIDAAAADLAMGLAWTRGRAWTEIDDDDDYQRALGVAAGLDGHAR
jgi:choline kinase